MPVQPRFPFAYPRSRQVSMPMGGLGAGCLGLNGEGGIVDFAIRHRPAVTALPDGWGFYPCAFGILRTGGRKSVAKLLEGPLPAAKIYDQGLQTQGYRHGYFEGLPRFRQSRFRAGYPFGEVALEHPDVPLQVALTGWSPFVPLDDVTSGLPCAILEYTFSNRTRRPVPFEFSFHLSHLAGRDGAWARTRNEVIRGRGIHFYNEEPAGSEDFGSASLTVIGHRPAIKAMWLRGGWFDAGSALWREVERGAFQANNGKEDAGCDGRNGGSLLVAGTLAPGEAATVPVVITWHFPNSNQGYGRPAPAPPAPAAGDPPKWRPFYASKFQDARAVAGYVHANYESLRGRTLAFQHALLSSTLPVEVLDAVSSNLAILKSPTILRQENGNVWAWEGCFPESGSCHGSCTHVWNYAQALPHLFPPLERTLREQEWRHSMDEQGHVCFRSALPTGPTPHDFHPAADGQLGGMQKLYRDWHISGDTGWLREMYPLARRSLEYGIRKWDPGEQGVLTEAHHNTYDIEFWGTEGMCTTIYVGALSAMSLMAGKLGISDDEARYGDMARQGAARMEKLLFNGEYFEQKVNRRGWQTDLAANLNRPAASSAMARLTRREGPRYQYGSGCLSDSLLGAWMSKIYGIPTPFDRRKILSNLRAIHRHNFRADLSDHANTQRPGYALGKEGGLLLCSWPRGGKPTLPFVYSDEVWTGIEYQVASHLAAEGFADEALQMVRAVRSRYDGDVRNPFNEYECGSYYARAMASYALLGAFSGFRYSAIEKKLWFAPISGERPFACFFCCASGFGRLVLSESALTITVIEGTLALRHLSVVSRGKTFEIALDATIEPAAPKRVALDREGRSPNFPVRKTRA